MEEKSMKFTLWDVGHGLSIWMKTPNGHNHWIDAGNNAETDFHPAERVKNHYGETELDYLIISHPDADHIADLPSVIEYLGEPRVLSRNKSLPDEEKYGKGDREYQKIYENLDKRYTQPVPESTNPKNPEYNGGIRVVTEYLEWNECMDINNSSVVIFYLYGGWLFIFPGDIEESGWLKLWQKNSSEFESIIKQANWRILIAPHHGRKTGYSQQMFDNLEPHLVLISDKFGQEPTDSHFRDNPIGINQDGQKLKYLSTKNGGRIKFVITESGKYAFNQLYLKDLK